MRWIVGDVHGCALELERLLAQIRFEPGRDQLGSVGDLINRGPDSLAVLRLWRDLGGSAVLGNHELYALAVRDNRTPRRPDTLDELFGTSEGEELLAGIAGWPVLTRLPGEVETWLVHAGVHPAWRDLAAAAERLNHAADSPARAKDEEIAFATRVRCCTPEGERVRHTGSAEGCPAGSRPWDAFYAGPARIVHGHWAARGFYRGSHTMSLDSACVYGGALTAWCPETDRVEWVSAL
ncbi:MAG TPA: metallophosphoesterase [Candidatus Polarisedimenticolaceae bacterium]|nr:metallophosphoesterase [Candidatus Polarisedimenticolaceae bacterium]